MSSHLPKSHFRLWLSSVYQTLTHAEQALLVAQQQDGTPAIYAKWPENKAANKGIVDTARATLHKQRMHLEAAETGTYLGYPIDWDGQQWGVLVIHLAKKDPASMQNNLKMIQSGTIWLKFLLLEESSPTIEPTAAQADIDILARLLREKSLAESAITFVNYLAANINASRVSLGLFNNRKAKLIAVSSMTHVESQTEPMQNIVRAMQEAFTQGKNLVQQLPISTVPSNELIHHTNLLERHKLVSAETLLLRSHNQIIAALTIENSRPVRPNSKIATLLNDTGPYLAEILRLQSCANISLYRLVKNKLSSFTTNLFSKHGRKQKLTVFVVVSLILAVLIPIPYTISTQAVLESENKHLLVAPFDGYTSKIYVKPGDVVKKLQLLAELNSETLTLERRKLSSELQQYRLEYDNALAMGNRAQSAIINSQVEQAKIQLRLIETKLQKTQLSSPINGIIVSDDISQTVGAPIKQGEILFEIAEASDYLVTIYIDERDIRDVSIKQQGKLSLTSLPSTHVNITVDRITPLSEIRDNRNYFRVDAKLQNTPSQLQPGMTGTAKLDVEKRALGWILFHDIWHWLRLKFWL